MTLKRLLLEIGDDELPLWVAWDQMHPLDDSWLETSTLQATMIAVAGGEWPNPHKLLPTLDNMEDAEKLRVAKDKAAFIQFGQLGKSKEAIETQSNTLNKTHNGLLF